MKIGLPRIEPIKWALQANFEAFLRTLDRAGAAGVELCTSSECFLDGYAAADKGSTRERLFEVAQTPGASEFLDRVGREAASRKMSIVFGFTQRDGDKLYNAAGLWDSSGKLIGVYHKTHLQSHDKQFDPGESLPVFETCWGPVGIMICADRRWPEVARCLRLGGARLILCPSYGMHGEANEWWMRTRAYENDCFVAFAHPKTAFIAEPGGGIAAKTGETGELLVAEIDLSKADKHHHLDDRRPELYSIICRPERTYTWWEATDMHYCAGEARDSIRFDGRISTIELPGDGSTRSLVHGIQYADLTADTFVLEFGRVPPWVEWELGAAPHADPNRWLPLKRGSGGGAHRVPLVRLGLPRWAGVDMVLRLRADKPTSIEMVRWAVEAPGEEPFAGEHARVGKLLARAGPVEHGIVRHFNPDLGAFVCAYNRTHPEHYNYWIEDEAEFLWSLGNYRSLMEVYGRPLRDFLVGRCRFGSTVRKVNNQPLLADPLLGGGSFAIDTGILLLRGEVARDPRIDMHQSIYDSHGLLASLGGFHVSYVDEGLDLSPGPSPARGGEQSAPSRVGRGLGGGFGIPAPVPSRLDFAEPTAWRIDYDKPKRDHVQIVFEASDSAISGRFTVEAYRGRLAISAEVANKGSRTLRRIAAGFELRDCDRYYRSALTSVRQFGDVTLLYADRRKLEECNIVRIAGPAARSVEIARKRRKIVRAGASAALAAKLAPGRSVSPRIAVVNAGSSSFADKIDVYEDLDMEDADISTSYVGTYALMGLATYCHRYTEDAEAREVTDRLIANSLAARHRLRDRELGYLLWTLVLCGREDDARSVADQIERYARGKEFACPHDSSAMAIGLRALGRWGAAERICARTLQHWGGVAGPTEVLAAGGFQPGPKLDLCYSQLSRSLRLMYWDAPGALTWRSSRWTQEGPQEVQAYTLVVFDLISRLFGGVVPVRLGPVSNAEITRMDFDEASHVWRADLAGAEEIDLFAHFREPKTITWKGRKLAPGKWDYSPTVGVIRIRGLAGDGELAVTVEGDPPQPEVDWPPIDYIGLGKRGKAECGRK